PDRRDDASRRVRHRRPRPQLRAGAPRGPRDEPRGRDRAARDRERMKLSYFTLTDNPVTFGAQRQDSNQLLLDTVEQAIAAEEMDLVVKAWTEESFTWRGKHHTIPDPVTVLPRVVQKPHPPIYVASFSEHSMRLAAARGFNILFAPFAAAMVFGSVADAVAKYRELARAAGHPNVKAACSYFTAVADGAAEVRAAKERLVFYLKGITPAFPRDMSKAPPSLRYFKEIVDRIHGMTPDQVGERSIVCGGRDDVVAHLKRGEA